MFFFFIILFCNNFFNFCFLLIVFVGKEIFCVFFVLLIVIKVILFLYFCFSMFILFLLYRSLNVLCRKDGFVCLSLFSFVMCCINFLFDLKFINCLLLGIFFLFNVIFVL